MGLCIRVARFVIPVEPLGTVLEDHCVVSNDKGTIVAVLPSAEATAKYAAANEVRRGPLVQAPTRTTLLDIDVEPCLRTALRPLRPPPPPPLVPARIYDHAPR